MSNYDDPSEIDSVELKIQAASGTPNLTFFANGRHQIPIEIIAKAKKINEITGEEKILRISQSKWIEMLSLCFAESDEKLNKMGNQNWCFTSEKNEFSGEIATGAHQLVEASIIILYVYTYDVGAIQLSVSLDTANGKHFTTADNAIGAEQMSIPIASVNEIYYWIENLSINTSGKKDSKDQPRLYYGREEKFFKCFYKNYYFSLKNGLRIVKANVYNYGDVNSETQWISCYKNINYNSYMIASHPYGNTISTGLFGFDDTFTDYTYRLKQSDVIYNDKSNSICYTHLTFLTAEVWKGYHEILDKSPIMLEPHFEIYDEYGNYGSFYVDFSDDLTSIVVGNY